ncbi:AmiS/UreI family transporter [Arthrobacter sp. 135MFCol5.1]|uniref:AmiS/UreI family transporter n=1 Tax=Arthrobacter sp. 135MFCol5.1 TaxID=1158050 RepID=UPI00037CFC40|nr:AmiS/UreI family transporter [Arthrobacter sp. 135MFCol5.1]
MPFICLLLSGAALLANGLATLGHVPRRDAAALNLLVGGTQLVLAVVYVSAAGDAPAPLLTAAGMFLFGATYLYSGLDVLLGLGSRGLGWFCGLVAFCGMLLATAWLGADPLLAVLWVCWSALWALLFACLALGAVRLERFTGWALVLAAPASATIPALLGLAGLWPASPAAAWGGALIGAILIVAARALARREPKVPRRASAGDPAPAR